MYYQQFLEVYFGENKNIKAMQECITKVRNDIQHNPLLSKINCHPEVKKFNRLAEKEWGFEGFVLTIIPDMQINAFTLPLWYTPGTLFEGNNSKKHLKVNGRGYKFDEDSHYICGVYVYKGVFMSKEITDREIMGIILHEIGHNFQAAISNTQASMATASYMLAAVQAIIEVVNIRSIHDAYEALIMNPLMLLGQYNRLNKAIDDVLYQNFKGLYHLKDVVQGIYSILSYPINKVIEYISYMIAIPLSPLIILAQLTPYNVIRMMITGNYRGEKIADNFATIYGYGVETASVEEKFMGDELLKKVKIPVISPMLGFVKATAVLLLSLPDEHPQAITRIKDQRDYLSKELASADMDPKVKKQLQAQIRTIDAQIDRLSKFSYEGAISDSTYFNKMYQAILYKLFGGDIKELGLLDTHDIHSDLQDVKNKKMNESDQSSIFESVFNRIKLL